MIQKGMGKESEEYSVVREEEKEEPPRSLLLLHTLLLSLGTVDQIARVSI